MGETTTKYPPLKKMTRIIPDAQNDTRIFTEIFTEDLVDGECPPIELGTAVEIVDGQEVIKELEHHVLYLDDTGISDVTKLPTKVRSYSLRNNNISTLKGFPHFDNTNFIFLQNNKIEHIDVEDIPMCEVIFLEGNPVQDLINDDPSISWFNSMYGKGIRRNDLVVALSALSV